MIITFIGNCQTVSLCYFFQQLLNHNNNIYYLSYSERFNRVLGKWSYKVKNKITDYTNSIEIIKKSDIIDNAR